MTELDRDIMRAVVSDRVPTELVVRMREICSRGILAVRVTPNGRRVDSDILLITGAYVSGLAGDPRSIKVYTLDHSNLWKIH